MPIFKDIPNGFYQCNDGTYSDHNRTGACNFHGGIENNQAIVLGNNDNGITYVHLNKIFIATKIFQGRKDSFSSRSVSNIVEAVKNNTFRWSNFDAITLWENPKDKKLYILSGHSRTEAFRILCREGWTIDGKDFCRIPAKIERNINQAQAKKIALESNTLVTPETDIERSKYYRSLRMTGTPEKEIETDIKRNEGRNSTTILAFSFLNPDGKIFAALVALESGEASSRTVVKNVARWIGNARRRFNQLTNHHENEIYEWLIVDRGFGTGKSQISNERQFIDRLVSVINRRTEFGILQDSLNLKSLLSKSPTEKQFDKQVQELQLAIRDTDKQLKNKIAELTQRGGTPSDIQRITQGLESTIRRQRIELQQLLNKKSQVLQHAKNEVSLFDNITGILNTEIQTGDILVRRARVIGYLHYGIAVVEDDGRIKVYHNSPRRGRIAFESLEEFLEGKSLRRIDGDVGINSPKELAEIVMTFSNRSFNWLTWNCEHFVRTIAGQKVKSPQVRKTLLFGTGLLYLWSSRKKNSKIFEDGICERDWISCER